MSYLGTTTYLENESLSNSHICARDMTWYRSSSPLSKNNGVKIDDVKQMVGEQKCSKSANTNFLSN